MNTPSESAPMRPRVLFVGDDASSPQIAASLLRDAVGDRVAVYTAGTEFRVPGDRPDEMLVAMGLNPADEMQLTAGTLHAADRVVVLGADLDVARLPGPRYEVWDLKQGDLVDRVRALADALTVPARRRRSGIMGRLSTLPEAIRRRSRRRP